MYTAEFINASVSFQVTTLKEEVETLKADRERVNSSMKDIIHGAEGYKVGGRQLALRHACYQKTIRP